ncbi:MAG: Hpt domain-containing protein [Bacteroidetes bacterium]|nr:Hpt domain-containing protein [Bacteroidota bacterium]
MDTFQYFDKPIVLEIIDIFLNECDGRLESIRQDIATNNMSALKFDAHSFKGVVSNFMADETTAIARELEQRGANGNNEGLNELFEKLQKSSTLLLADLRELRKEFEE